MINYLRLKALNRKLTSATVGMPRTRQLLRWYLKKSDGEAFLGAVSVAAITFCDVKDVGVNMLGHQLNSLYDEFKWDLR